jgi:hypothetical protein
MCHWKVIWPAAGVYAAPSRDSTLLKTKHSGNVVGPYCDTSLNTTENETYVQVELGESGTGWMRRNALTPTS